MAVNRPRPNFQKATLGVPKDSRPPHLIPNVRLHTATDIVEFLKANFQPACIGRNDREVDAHRRAGEVELAQRLIATIEYSQEHRGEETLEE